MPNLQIDKGDLRISINDDPARVLVFNPRDVLFAEKFYRLVAGFKVKLADFEKRADAIEASTEEDENGVPLNMQERFDLIRETCEYIRGQIDGLFGEGTSQMVFGEAMNLEAFVQFFDGLAPFMQAARSEKLGKYAPK